MASQSSNDEFKVSGNLIDIHQGSIYPAEVLVKNKKIVRIDRVNRKYNNYLLPGFIDAHIHIESSMLPPSEFARIAVVHGTVATVSDPHEIANVLGVKGVEYMLADSKKVPFKFYFGAPSCVPATNFETSGASIGVKETDYLLKKKEIYYLSEMMNYPGVINKDKQVLAKINLSKKYRKPIDGHAPGLTGPPLKKYIRAGITTDHESYHLNEALEKIKLGMKIIIREGSAAKNFRVLHPLIKKYPLLSMFGSDDKHPDELHTGHINLLVKRALDLGYDLIDVLRIASLNPVNHYRLDVGQLRVGDWADFIVIDNLKNFRVISTYINGSLVSKNGRSQIKRIKPKILNRFEILPKKISDFRFPSQHNKIKAIVTLDGQLITKYEEVVLLSENGSLIPDPLRDILKITVVNRYADKKPAVAFIKNFGLKNGAIASSVAHDSHNIIAVGTNDADLVLAVNGIIRNKGGLSLVSNGHLQVLPLTIGGLMSHLPASEVAAKYHQLDYLAKKLGSKLSAPFMTLSFMALLVIPHIKLSDIGLFDADLFHLIN
ncbi:adenine deaminase [Candidatus Gottesmanbacteria bacterium RBG_16_37_8]|uniref:Adenine deaminase n=1 Tax=Candidatus Gottesmanbacteria bacterium RBG_16_37_8 TaxID=1798371 RepID=A0A1F5YR98_9BACT|nr:MAG: adenine deaminase [Candidatus Gottesmanbacteria bacterium RBG_16_37_8]